MSMILIYMTIKKIKKIDLYIIYDGLSMDISYAAKEQAVNYG